MKLLSLFDGSGGFPLAGAMCGIIPVAASEIEPFPIRVTTKRFPQMKHLGDISKVNGAEIEPVDIITFGSPCQDLSVAGKRKGLNHSELGDEETTRSGLFMEAIRIIREMKEATNGQYPTFAVWENVPGAYSSNKGEDFRTVLEELEKTACGDTVHIPEPPKGKWLNAGEILGDNYSIAWRTLDAQFWGVPQRRRRIYLVADFRGKRAGKILFEREGLRGNFTQSGTQGQGTAENAENGIGTADRASKGIINLNKHDVQSKAIIDPKGICPCLYSGESRYGGGEVYVLDMLHADREEKILTAELGIASRDGGHCYENIAGTLRANAGDNQLSVVYAEDRERCVVYDGSSVTSPINAQNPELGDPCHTLNTDSRNYVVYAVENHPADSRVNIDDSGKVQTLTSRMGTGGGNVPLVMEKPVICLQGNGIDRADTAGCNGKGWKEDTSYTLNTVDRPAVAYSLDSLASNSMKSKNPHSGCRVVDKAKTLDTSTQDPSKNQGGIAIVQQCQGIDGYNSALTGDKSSTLGVNCGMSTGRNGVCLGEPHYIVRRLTPLECCRLQGFPDCWCNGLETPEPTEEDLYFWREVFETHRTVISGTSKPKTDKQIIKWLKDPYSDSAIYKMWGNGIALPNALFVMQGIAEELCKK